MTNKDKYIAELRTQHPELPQEFFDFCAAIPDYDKRSEEHTSELQSQR